MSHNSVPTVKVLEVAQELRIFQQYISSYREALQNYEAGFQQRHIELLTHRESEKTNKAAEKFLELGLQANIGLPELFPLTVRVAYFWDSLLAQNPTPDDLLVLLDQYGVQHPNALSYALLGTCPPDRCMIGLIRA